MSFQGLKALWVIAQNEWHMTVRLPFFWYTTCLTPIILIAIYSFFLWIIDEDPREKLLKEGITKNWEYFLDQPWFLQSTEQREQMNYAVFDPGDLLATEIRSEIELRDQVHLLRTVFEMNDEDFASFQTQFAESNSELFEELQEARTQLDDLSKQVVIEQFVGSAHSNTDADDSIARRLHTKFSEWWPRNFETLTHSIPTLSSNFFNDVTPGRSSEQNILSMLAKKEIVGYFAFPDEFNSHSAVASFYVHADITRGKILHLVNWYQGIGTDVLHRRQLEIAGIAPQVRTLLLQKTTFSTNSVELDADSFVIPEQFYKYVYVVLPILLWIVLIASSMRLVSNVSEEKSSKFAEAILSNISPTQLLDGKLWGTALISCTVAAIWLIIIPLFISITSRSLGHIDPTLIGILLRPDVIFNFLLFMLLVYAFYGYPIVACSTAFSRLDNAVKAVFLLLFVIGILFVTPTVIIPFIPFKALQDILSIFPLSMPFVMVARSGSLPNVFMYGALVALMIASIFGSRALFARWFGRGITDEIRSSKLNQTRL